MNTYKIGQPKPTIIRKAKRVLSKYKNLLENNKEELIGKGPIGKFFSKNSIEDLAKICNLKENDAVFFSCDKEKNVEKLCDLARQKLGKELKLINDKKLSEYINQRYKNWDSELGKKIHSKKNNHKGPQSFHKKNKNC